MNILIIGGSGFLASNCIKLLQKNNTIHVFDQKINTTNNSVIFSQIKLTEYIQIITYIQKNNINLVMHFASGLLPKSNIADFETEIKDIYLPTLKLLEFCAEGSIKFVYISSGGAIYGNNNNTLIETSPKEPISLYGLAKLNLENAIQFYNRTKQLQYLIIRPSNPYGPGQNLYGKQGLIAVIIGKILKNQPIEIYGNGFGKKDYIYVDDFAYYVSELINQPKSNWNTVYNIGSGIGHSINEILEIFRKSVISLPQIKYTESMESDVQNFVLDCEKIKRIINHKNKTIEEGVKLFYDFAVNTN